MITISRALLWGLALGFVWWLIFSLLLANIMSHRAPFGLDFERFLSTFPIVLLFGVVLGAIYFQLKQQRAAAALKWRLFLISTCIFVFVPLVACTSPVSYAHT